MALYQEVKKQLIADIQSGRFVPEKALPNETDLAARFAVSVGTVRRAVEELASEHILLRQQGRGTFVARLDQHRFMFQFFKIDGRNGSREFPRVDLLAFSAGKANVAESLALDVSIGAKVFRIDNLLYLQEQPVVHDHITVAASRFPQLSEEQLLQRSGTIYELYQNAFGVVVVNADERVRAAPVAEPSAAWLTLGVGAPVLQVERIARCITGRPVELRVSVVNTAAHDYVASRSNKP